MSKTSSVRQQPHLTFHLFASYTSVHFLDAWHTRLHIVVRKARNDPLYTLMEIQISPLIAGRRPVLLRTDYCLLHPGT